jgi:hypothetical protein
MNITDIRTMLLDPGDGWHAPHDGHADCIEVARKIRAGEWNDRDRFRPLPRGR